METEDNLIKHIDTGRDVYHGAKMLTEMTEMKGVWRATPTTCRAASYRLLSAPREMLSASLHGFVGDETKDLLKIKRLTWQQNKLTKRRRKKTIKTGSRRRQSS